MISGVMGLAHIITAAAVAQALLPALGGPFPRGPIVYLGGCYSEVRDEAIRAIEKRIRR